MLEIIIKANEKFDLNKSENNIWNSSKITLKKSSLVLNNEQFREDYIQKGKTRVKQFDWDNAVIKCSEVYLKSVIK